MGDQSAYGPEMNESFLKKNALLRAKTCILNKSRHFIHQEQQDLQRYS